MASEETGERATACWDAPLTQCANHLIERQIRLLPIRARIRWEYFSNGEILPPRCIGSDRSIVAKALQPSDRGTNADVELFGRLASGSSCFHEINNSNSHRARIRSPHGQAPAESMH